MGNIPQNVELFNFMKVFHCRQPYTELEGNRGYGFILLILDGLRPTIDSEKIDEDIAELIKR